MANRPEELVHKGVLAAVRLLYPVGIVFHIPNQRFGKIVRIILASLGVLGGIPDLGIMRPYGRMGWIEVKAKGSRLNDNQKALHPRMAFLGHRVHVVDDVDQVAGIVAEWKREDELIKQTGKVL